MGLTDFAGVFSRAFIVGYFIPSFFALFLVELLVDARSLPHALAENRTGSTQVLVVGGLGLLIGLLLSGLGRPLLRLFQGYRLRNARSRLLRSLDSALSSRWRREFDTLTAALAGPRSPERSAAAAQLKLRFPPRRDLVLATALGNAIRSFETHPRARYNVDGITMWPRIELLLADGERDVVADAQTNVMFFLNGAALIVLAALALLVDRVVHASGVPAGAWQGAVVVAAGALLFWGCYLAAVSAVVDWGASVRAAFDVHRLEVYAKLGVRAPASPDEEQRIGRAVSRFLLYGEAIARSYRQPRTRQDGR